jgi:hypothetical protein
MNQSHDSAARPLRSEAFFEAALFRLLPGGVLTGSLVLYVVVVTFAIGVGSLIQPDLWQNGFGNAFRPVAMMLILLAIPVIALGTERWAQHRLGEEARLFEASSRPVPGLDPELSQGEARSLWLASAIGAGLGLVSIALFVMADLRGDVSALLLRGEIFPALLMMTVLILLARAIARSVAVAQLTRNVCRGAFDADPLRPERLHLFGRVALRQAFVWFGLALGLFAVLLLGLRGVLFQLIFAVCIAAGAITFWSLVAPVHKAVATTRQTALDGVRDRMEAIRDAAFRGSQAEAGAYAALAAEEDRLRRAGEWPVSAPVTRSLLVFGAGPALAWFGAALTERLVSAISG